MSRPFDIYLPEVAYHRSVLFALEVLDAVTLERLTQGLEVVAEGLKGLPITNASGFFVWLLPEDPNALQKVTIEPGALPFERVEIAAAAVQTPLTIVELPPRSDYPFPAGVTGIRGSLVEHRVVPPARPQPVSDAEVRLLWLDDDGVTWRDPPVRSRADSHGGFATILRFAPNDVPRVDVNGDVTVRLRAQRPGRSELGTAAFALSQGRVADRSAYYAWDELQP